MTQCCPTPLDCCESRSRSTPIGTIAGVTALSVIAGFLLALPPHSDSIPDNLDHSLQASPTALRDIGPIEFIPNAAEAGFDTHTRDYTVHARPGRIRIEWPGQRGTLDMRPVGGRENVRATGVIRREPNPLREGGLERIRYGNIYEGIDLELYGNRGRLEYDFIVAPGAAPESIRLAFTGADQIFVDQNDALTVRSGAHTFRQPRPVVYQTIGGKRRPIDGDFVIYRDATVGFRIGDYDPRFALIIDPILEYGSFVGGTGTDQVQSIATDALGNTYVTGTTTSGGLPGVTVTRCTSGGCSTGGTIDHDVFVSKFAADGQLEFTTYLGGQGYESGQGIAVDATGIYIGGWTSSRDFPVTDGSQLNLGSGTAPNDQGFRDAFVAKLSPTGDSVLYATYIGGSADDAGLALRIDGSGQAYIAGFTTSSDLPSAGTPYQTALAGKEDAFVARLDATGTLNYGSYLGGQSDDVARDLAVDAAGRITLTGYTGSGDYDNSSPPNAMTPFPTTSNAYDIYCGIAETIAVVGSPTKGRCNGKGTPTQASTDYDAFVTRIDPSLSPASAQLLYSSYLGGGRYDYGNTVAVDSSGDIVVGGVTVAADFPVTMETCSDSDDDGRCDNRSADGFIAKIHPAGAGASDLVFARYLAGDAEDTIQSLTLDSASRIYVTGSTTSRDFPVVNPIQPTLPQRQDEAVLVLHRDAFVSEFSADGAQQELSSYLGGRGDDQGTSIALDSNGVVHLGGYTVSANLPISTNAAQSSHGDLQTGDAVTADDGFLLRVGTQSGDLSVALSHNAPDPLTLGQTVTFTAVVTNLSTTDTADGVTLTDIPPIHAEGTALTELFPALVFDADQSDPSCRQYAGIVQCAPGSIGPGQDKRIAIAFKPKNQGDYTYTVSTSGWQSETDSSNNEASAILHVAYVSSPESGSAAMSPISLLMIGLMAALVAFRRWRLRADGEAY